MLLQPKPQSLHVSVGVDGVSVGVDGSVWIASSSRASSRGRLRLSIVAMVVGARPDGPITETRRMRQYLAEKRDEAMKFLWVVAFKATVAPVQTRSRFHGEPSQSMTAVSSTSYRRISVTEKFATRDEGQRGLVVRDRRQPSSARALL